MILDDIGDYDEYPYDVGDDDAYVVAANPGTSSGYAVSPGGPGGGGGGPPTPGPGGGPGQGGGGTIGYSEYLHPSATVGYIGEDDQESGQSNYGEWLGFASGISDDVFGYLKTREETRQVKYSAPHNFRAPFRGGRWRNRQGEGRRRRRGGRRRMPNQLGGGLSGGSNMLMLGAVAIGAYMVAKS